MKKPAPKDVAHIVEPLRRLAVPVSTLHYDPQNARAHDDRALEAVRRSLVKHGQRLPIVVQRRGMIVRSGNARLAMARELGWRWIAAVIVDDDTATATAWGITDNRTAELSSWDDAALARLLSKMDEEQRLNVGFDQDEFERVLEAAAELVPPASSPAGGGPAGPAAEDLAKPARPTTKPGQLLVLGRHRVFCGSSTSPDDVRRCLGRVVPGLMVTDPPYGVEYSPAWRNDTGVSASKNTATIANDDRASWASAWVLFPGNVAYVWHAGLFAGEVQRSLLAAGLEPRSQIVWVKRRFALSRGAYHWRHEPCWFAVRKGAVAMWRGGRKQDTVWADIVDQVESGKAGELFAAALDADRVTVFDAARTTVWDMAHDKSDSGGHPTQKPIEAMARPIRNHDAGAVYDPFLGTGTTVLAAEQEGRVCHGMEIDPAWCDVIVRRWEAMTGEKARRK